MGYRSSWLDRSVRLYESKLLNEVNVVGEQGLSSLSPPLFAARSLHAWKRRAAVACYSSLLDVAPRILCSQAGLSRPCTELSSLHLGQLPRIAQRRLRPASLVTAAASLLFLLGCCLIGMVPAPSAPRAAATVSLHLQRSSSHRSSQFARS